MAFSYLTPNLSAKTSIAAPAPAVARISARPGSRADRPLPLAASISGTCSARWPSCGPGLRPYEAELARWTNSGMPLTPASLMTRAGEDLVERLPEPHGPVAHGNLGRHRKAARLDVNQKLAPVLGALAHADLKADELFLSFGRGAENGQDTFGLRLHWGLQVDTVRPDAGVMARREIAVLPAVVVLLPLPGQARDHTR